MRINYYRSLLISFLLIMAGLLPAMRSMADGSRNLYPSGAVGGRAYLVSSATDFTTSNATGYDALPFMNAGVHYVFARVGEIIYTGSSAQGRNGKIKIYKPNGDLYGETQINVTTDQASGTINNRTQELAGPTRPGVTTGYTPFTATVGVGEQGIWRVEFIAPAGESNNASPQAG